MRFTGIGRDRVPEMGGNSEFSKICREYRIKSSFTEPYSPWQNRCENMIGVLSKKLGQGVRGGGSRDAYGIFI